MRTAGWKLLSTIALALVSQLSYAQSDSWGNVRQLPQGQQIKLVLANGSSRRGILNSVTDEAITVKGNQAIPKQDVRRILSKGRGHRGRHALIGAGIGAGVGLGLGAAIDNDCTRTSIVCTGNKAKAIATPIFAFLGLLVGTALPAGGWHEVYRSK